MSGLVAIETILLEFVFMTTKADYLRHSYCLFLFKEFFIKNMMTQDKRENIIYIGLLYS